MSPKIAVLDIECSPIVSHTWGLKNQFVNLNQIIEDPRVISFASKWIGARKKEFYSEYHDGREEMLKQAHRIMDEADAIVHYNGSGFDIPWLKGEFARLGWTPPSPHKNIDLFRVAKSQFRFPSLKLQYVSTALGLKGKVAHTGHQLWVDCLNGDEETKARAWRLMKRYNLGDIDVSEELYFKMLPWISSHPHWALYTDGDEDRLCQNCGGVRLERRGFARTDLGKYRRYQCLDCGKWQRGKKAVQLADVRGIQ